MNNQAENSEMQASCRPRVFGRDFRLRNREQLDAMRSIGHRHVGRYCVIVIAKAPPDDTRRVAFLISRKYSLLAVDRNRARRLFREAYRMLVSQIGNAWMLFIPRHQMKHAALDDVLRETRKALLEAESHACTDGR